MEGKELPTAGFRSFTPHLFEPNCDTRNKHLHLVIFQSRAYTATDTARCGVRDCEMLPRTTQLKISYSVRASYVLNSGSAGLRGRSVWTGVAEFAIKRTVDKAMK